MEIASLIAALSEMAAYPAPVANVDVRQTHISVVFLAGDHVYKIKKPVKLSFLDFRTLEARRHFCEEELRLNRRLAPEVYLAVVPVTRDGSRIAFEGAGKTVEWAVKMQRLPESATLDQYLSRNQLDEDHVRHLGRRLADFHACADRSAHIASFGRFEVVAANIRENFSVSAPTIGQAVSTYVRRRLIDVTEQSLAELRPMIDERARRGVTCDTHGDLHLDHVYLFPERRPPADLVIVDCIEFNERFRYADPVADMAFLAMDFEFHARRDLAAAFVEAYFSASGDAHGRQLLPLYLSYRAAVRGKVDGLQLAEPEIPEEARARTLTRARGHWLLALGDLEASEKRPCLVLVGGLPGTGKSTLAAQLAARANFHVIRSDVVRKELARLSPETPSVAGFGTGLYAADWTRRTYAECLRRAEQLLFDGERVIVDASFIDEERRAPFFDASRRWGVPTLFLICQADQDAIQARLAARRGDASDADWNVYLEAAKHWEEPSRRTLFAARSILTNQSADRVLDLALQALAEAELAGDSAAH